MNNRFDLRLVAAALAALVSACSSTSSMTTAQPTIFAAFDVGSINNDGTQATLTVTAFDATGRPGTGTVTITAPYGDVNVAGAQTATVTLDANGSGKVTYACVVTSEPRCTPGSVLLTAKWGAIVNGASVSLKTPGSAPPPDSGGPPPPDGGVPAGSASKLSSLSISPAYVFVSSFATANPTFPGTATATFLVTDANNAPVPSTIVTLIEKPGETLVTLVSATSTSNSSGVASFTINSKDTAGVAHLTASLTGGATVALIVPVLGGPTSIVETTAIPDVLGLKGSGIQETGLMTFLVTDSTGAPVPGAVVTFSLTQPALVVLGHTSGTTNDVGKVTVDYISGTEVGVSSLRGTVTLTGATSAHAVAVRGARPSASFFYFQCAKANLPVYTSTPRLETMTCEVRLKDRFGNRVGVPTPVNFATEAGAITASAVTKGFDPNNPNDPAEGTVTVTFTSDLGNGSSPADVVPLAADPAQLPWPRLAEPSVASGSLTRNPRDQLVTIIAMTQGEEGFIDANHNGVLDVNEVFFDLGDPFIDANDDGLYNQIYPGGPWEVRFCGDTSNCAAYRGPNGVWDALTTIWVPTWVVFTGVPVPHTNAAGKPPLAPPPPPGGDYSPTCLAGGLTAGSDIYVYDSYLNGPASGGTYGAPTLESTTTVVGSTNITLKKSGFFNELDAWGAMGLLGFNFDYRPISPTGGPCAAPATPTVPTACWMKMLFRDFDTGFRGTILASNAAAATATCPAPSVFKTSITANGAHSTAGVGFQSATYAP